EVRPPACRQCEDEAVAIGGPEGGWCQWHDGPTSTVLVACWGMTTSGPDQPINTCADCRVRHSPTPVGG
ncbi:hypothetical protein ADK55_19105, partial [Streptomyces sp. WM4235]